MADNEYKIPILSAAQLKKSKDEAHDREIRQNVKSHCTKIKDGITKNGSTSGNRAIWELFQNAGDLADCAEIKMTLTDNAFVFAHKGKPFTYDTLCSLVKQVSSEEKEDVEKVGQYGTGFLTTHKFSRKITIQGSMLICEDPKVYVDITDFVIDRENSYDIPKFIEDMAHQIKAVEKLMDNEQKTKPREWTELSYELNDERKKIAQTAIDEAIKLLPFVLTFNDNIGSCIIDDNTRNYHLVYTKEDKTTSIENLLCKQIIRNSTGIHKSKEYNCYYLELHEGKSRILLPLKSENEVISFGNTPRLFVHFPLIGPDYFKVDFLFHSHLFTPEEPRDNIIVPRENDATDQAASANKKVLDEMTAYLWGFLEQHVTQWKNTIQMAPIHIKDSGFTDAKTEEFYKNLKATWVEEFIKLLIVEVDGTNVSMAANNHPLVLDPKLENFLSMEENKRFLPTIYSYAHHVATIPSQDNLLSWSRIIAEWDKDKSEWYLTLDAIVKYVSLHQGTHLKEILLMLVEANELSFFETYPLLPNREMMLMKKNELRNAKSIIPELYKLVYAFDSSICAKFVHEEYADIVELTDYSRQDLRRDLQEVVKQKEDEYWKSIDGPTPYDGDFLKNLISLCSVFTSESESKRSKLMPIICKYENLVFTKRIIPAWKDDPQGFDMYRQLFLSLVENEMMKIATLSSEWVKQNKETLVSFVDNARGDDYKSFCTRYAIYPDKNGELHTPDKLYKDVNILPKLYDFYKKVIGKDLKSICVDPDFDAFYEPFENSEHQLDSQNIANQIQNQLAAEKNNDPIVLDIIDLTELKDHNGDNWRMLFRTIYDQRQAIRYNLGSEEERKAINRMMKQKNPKLLEKMADVAEMDNPDDVLNKVQEAIHQLEHDAYIKTLGGYVERNIQKFIVDSLQGAGITVDNVQGGQDLILKKDGHKDYFIEIKSRWENKASAIMSPLQFKNAVANPDRYSVISAQMWNFDKKRAKNDSPITLDEMDPLLKTCSNIGHLEEDLEKRVSNVFDNSTEEDIRIQGAYEVLVPQKYFNNSFPDLIALLKDYFK